MCCTALAPYYYCEKITYTIVLVFVECVQPINGIIDPTTFYSHIKKKAISTELAPLATVPFSQAVDAKGLVFTSGQIHLTPSGELLEGTIQEKTHQVLKNLQNILDATRCTLADVVKVSIYVTDMSNYASINEVYATYFKAPFPAREIICVRSLPLGADLEISMIAVKKT